VLGRHLTRLRSIQRFEDRSAIHIVARRCWREQNDQCWWNKVPVLCG
jgi:hypothetical protein